jgi:16S rRNA processing protein RimM
MGRVVGVFGVRGWLKVYSYTEPRSGLLDYSPWILRTRQGTQVRKVLDGRDQGNGVVASLEGVEDRDAAMALIGAEIEVERARLPATARGEFYWADLEGMEVRNLDGSRLGVLDHLMATGSNDVMVILGEGRHLVPFIYDQVVRDVDLRERRITVAWPVDGPTDEGQDESPEEPADQAAERE